MMSWQTEVVMTRMVADLSGQAPAGRPAPAAVFSRPPLFPAATAAAVSRRAAQSRRLSSRLNIAPRWA